MTGVQTCALPIYPQSEPSLIDLDEQKVRGWLEKGAQPTESVAKLLKASGIQ